MASPSNASLDTKLTPTLPSANQTNGRSTETDPPYFEMKIKCNAKPNKDTPASFEMQH